MFYLYVCGSMVYKTRSRSMVEIMAEAARLSPDDPGVYVRESKRRACMYYAIFDTTARPSNHGRGFYNTKAAVAFRSRGERDRFVELRDSWDFSARSITRKKAMRMLVSVYGERDKGLPVGSPDSGEMVVLRRSRV